MKLPWQHFQEWVAARLHKRVHAWAKVVAGSGSGIKKLDVDSPEIKYECKDTKYASFRLDKETWLKAKHDATIEQKTAMMAIAIQDIALIVMDFEDYVAIMELSNEES